MQSRRLWHCAIDRLRAVKQHDNKKRITQLFFLIFQCPPSGKHHTYSANNCPGSDTSCAWVENWVFLFTLPLLLLLLPIAYQIRRNLRHQQPDNLNKRDWICHKSFYIFDALWLWWWPTTVSIVMWLYYFGITHLDLKSNFNPYGSNTFNRRRFLIDTSLSKSSPTH